MSDQNGNLGTEDSQQFSISFTGEEVKEMNRLGALCGLTTKKQAVEVGMAILSWVVRNLAYGRTNISANDPTTGKTEVLDVPALNHAAKALSIDDFTEEEIQERLSSAREVTIEELQG